MDETRSYTLAEALPMEQERCRELLKVYHELGPVGVFGATMISMALDRAERAAAAQDTVAMLRSLRELQECE